jgi:hypothetical protein
MCEENERLPVSQFGTGEEMAGKKEAPEGMKTGDASTSNSSSLLGQSTGPRTPEGKDRSKHNAINTGFFLRSSC